MREPNNVREERVLVLLDSLRAELNAIVAECQCDGSVDGELYEDAAGTLWLVGFLEATFDGRVISFYGVKSPEKVKVIEDRLDLRNLAERYFDRKNARLAEFYAEDE